MCFNVMQRRQDFSKRSNCSLSICERLYRHFQTFWNLSIIERKIMYKWEMFKTPINLPRSGCFNIVLL